MLCVRVRGRLNARAGKENAAGSTDARVIIFQRARMFFLVLFFEKKVFFVKLSINNHVLGLAHKKHSVNEI